jgi:hypothetical protein
MKKENKKLLLSGIPLILLFGLTIYLWIVYVIPLL